MPLRVSAGQLVRGLAGAWRGEAWQCPPFWKPAAGSALGKGEEED